MNRQGGIGINIYAEKILEGLRTGVVSLHSILKINSEISSNGKQKSKHKIPSIGKWSFFRPVKTNENTIFIKNAPIFP